ncbi:MAG: hypothetical protein JWO06_2093 [Bacteroidota bacterium]|nr:hypothetical protein [Bacteroidota bacterium]
MKSFLLFALALLPTIVKGQFNPKDQPAAPDYSLAKNWSSLPFRVDAADQLPGGEQWISDSLKNVDVFYIYPTIYRKGKTWNEDVSNEKLNKSIDSKPVRYQASVFNASCRVYVPRYRQAALMAFFDQTNGPLSLEFAYQDVKRAFQYYLDHYNNGRPIIIASHSQGTYHARKLLKEFFDSTDLRKRLVCAYVVGYGFDENMYQNLKPCTSATQTGCYVTWASFKAGFSPLRSGLYNTVCVNPITWNRDTIAVDRSKSMGALLLDFNHEYKQACSAQVHGNYLWVKARLPFIRGWTNLHIADYNLFWFDIRKNVRDRVEAFLKKSS